MNLNRKLYYYLIIYLFIFFAVSCRTEKTDSLSGSGSIEVNEIHIASIVPGRIEKISVDEGDSFVKEETLVVIKGDEIQADLDAAGAGLEAAGRNIELAEANFKNAKSELRRGKELFLAGSITQQNLESLQTRYNVTLSQWEASRAGAKQIKAVLSKANTRFKETVLKANRNGTVLTRNYEEGEVVMPGAPILTAADLSRVFIKIYIPERELPRIRLGQKAEVKADGMNEISPGTVTHISDRAEFTPKNVQTADARSRLVFAVKISLDNPKKILKPGMPADVKISAAE
jgi:HlyD family secretion protein